MKSSAPNSPLLKITFRGDDLAVIGKIPSKLKKLEHKITTDFTRFLPCDFYNIISILNQMNIPYETTINQQFSLNFSLTPRFVLRDYQEEALNKWLSFDQRGTLILPTGSGKTIIGLAAIEKLALLLGRKKRKYTIRN